jgi:hypothetical protein
MKRRLTLVLLFLLVAGTASLAVAQVQTKCPFCNEVGHVSAHYRCPANPAHWTVIDAYGSTEDPEDVYLINYCEWCSNSQWHMPSYLTCSSDICKGGMVYRYLERRSARAGLYCPALAHHLLHTCREPKVVIQMHQTR